VKHCELRFRGGWRRVGCVAALIGHGGDREEGDEEAWGLHAEMLTAKNIPHSTFNIQHPIQDSPQPRDLQTATLDVGC
jgi:hypothetical protein